LKFLIAGLGNIGAKYAHTRHNIGFDIVDVLAKKLDVEWDLDRLAFHCHKKYKGKSIHLIKPTTYMNLSGKSVRYWLNQNKVAIENLLVVYDDLAIPYGKIRLREKGSDGGHNGIKDINACLATSKYSRLRFGIGDDFRKGHQVDYVLDQWSKSEQAEIDQLKDLSVEAILSFCTRGIKESMNKYN